jgi:hypothetical protein
MKKTPIYPRDNEEGYEYTLNGVLHREGGQPAIEIWRDGQLYRQEYWQHGLRYNEDRDPAVLVYSGGKVVRSEWWYGGQKNFVVSHCDDVETRETWKGGCVVKRVIKTPEHTRTEHYVGKVYHRSDGPAVEVLHPNGGFILREWWEYGVMTRQVDSQIMADEAYARGLQKAEEDAVKIVNREEAVPTAMPTARKGSSIQDTLALHNANISTSQAVINGYKASVDGDNSIVKHYRAGLLHDPSENDAAVEVRSMRFGGSLVLQEFYTDGLRNRVGKPAVIVALPGQPPHRFEYWVAGVYQRTVL